MAHLRSIRLARPTRLPFAARLRIARFRVWLGHKRALRRGAQLVVILMVLSVVMGARSTISAAESEWGVAVSVLVVDEPIGVGEPIADRVRLDDLPAAAVPADAVTASAIGVENDFDERTIRSLLPGDIVTQRDLQSAQRSAALGEGQRALSLPKGPSVPELFVGDRVELVVVGDQFDDSVTASSTTAMVIDSNEETVTLSIEQAAIVEVVGAVADDRVVVVRS